MRGEEDVHLATEETERERKSEMSFNAEIPIFPVVTLVNSSPFLYIGIFLAFCFISLVFVIEVQYEKLLIKAFFFFFF